MSAPYDHGPLVPYQVMWRTGHIETIHAHQVIWPNGALGALFGQADLRDERVMLHGEIDGHWRLLLVADASDILSIRALDQSEVPS